MPRKHPTRLHQPTKKKHPFPADLRFFWPTKSQNAHFALALFLPTRRRRPIYKLHPPMASPQPTAPEFQGCVRIGQKRTTKRFAVYHKRVGFRPRYFVALNRTTHAGMCGCVFAKECNIV